MGRGGDKVQQDQTTEAGITQRYVLQKSTFDIVQDLATLLSIKLSWNLLIIGTVPVPMTISFLLIVQKVYIWFCLFVLRFYGPVNS